MAVIDCDFSIVVEVAVVLVAGMVVVVVSTVTCVKNESMKLFEPTLNKFESHDQYWSC